MQINTDTELNIYDIHSVEKLFGRTTVYITSKKEESGRGGKLRGRTDRENWIDYEWRRVFSNSLGGNR